MAINGVPRRRLSGWICALLAPPALTVGLSPFRAGALNLTSDALLFLVVAVATAVIGGPAPSLVAAVSGAVLLNFFFTPPFHKLTIEDPNDAVALIVFVIVSITVSVAVELVARHRRQLDEAANTEAALTKANELRTALLAAVGHDLRSPLAAAKGSVSALLSTEIDLSASDETELLQTTDEALDRLTALVANLLDMSRLQSGALAIDLQPTDVPEVVTRAQRELGRESVRILLPHDLPPVMADPGLLERVFANVLANAVRYSPDGIPPRVNASPTGNLIEVRVVDHGPGVPADRLSDIFSPFQRHGDSDPTTGLGLGLALSRGLIEAMDGALFAEPTPGGGLTIVVTLQREAAR
jgi:two-component system sensor histidine kinase KdpD